MAFDSCPTRVAESDPVESSGSGGDFKGLPHLYRDPEDRTRSTVSMQNSTDSSPDVWHMGLIQWPRIHSCLTEASPKMLKGQEHIHCHECHKTSYRSNHNNVQTQGTLHPSMAVIHQPCLLGIKCLH